MINISTYLTVKNHEEALEVGGTNTYFHHTDLPGYTISVGGVYIDSAEAILFGVTEVSDQHLSFSIATDDTGYQAVTLVSYDSEMAFLGNYSHGKVQSHNTSKELFVDDTTGEETYTFLETLTITTKMFFESITGLHVGVLAKSAPDSHIEFDHFINTAEGVQALEIWNALDHNITDRDPSEFIDNLQQQYEQYFMDGDDSAINTTPLAIGIVGQTITWPGAQYGLALPDNLHPCDGTTITSALSVLIGQSAPNYQGRSLVGTGSIPYNYTSTTGSSIVGSLQWNNNTKRGVPYKVLSAANAPKTTVSLPARTGSISGTAASKRAVGSGYTMWCFPDSVPDHYNTGSDIAGSGWKYPATNGPEYNTTGTHSHAVSGTCSISSTSTTTGNTYPSIVDMASPSIGVDMYIITY